MDIFKDFSFINFLIAAGDQSTPFTLDDSKPLTEGRK